MNEMQNNKLAVLVARHLALESQLADSLEDLNQRMASILKDAGLRGPTQQDVQRLDPITEEVKRAASGTADARKVLLARINLESNSDFSSIKEFVGSLPPPDAQRLDADRRAALERAMNAQASLVQNQASLYYTFDFHRKYLTGVLKGESDGQNYRADGQPSDVKSGNIFGKTC